MKRAKTPAFLIELPLQVDHAQASRLRAHLETARCLYNALLGEAWRRLQKMRNDPAWQTARAIPRSTKQERAQAFSHLRRTYHFSEYEMHEYARHARVSWIADHIDSTMAQTLATRAYQAVNRVCVGKAKKVRFRSRGRGIDSVEGKRNDVGMRFVLDPNAGDGGFLVWNAGISAPVDLGRSREICTRPSCSPLLNQENTSPRSPAMCGKVRSRACKP
jgi:hypothetical protein